MRLPALFTVALVVAASGCFGGDDEPTTTTPTPTATPTPTPTPEPSPTPEPEPTPTPPASPTPTPTPSPTPTPPGPTTPKEMGNVTFDFTTGDATNQAPQFRFFNVTAGYKTLVVNVTIAKSSTPATGLPVQTTVNNPKVTVLDPANNTIATNDKVDTTTTTASSNPTLPATVGMWTIRFEGQGTANAMVSAVAIP